MNDRLRRMLDRSPEDSMQDIDKRSMIWTMFMSSTLEASVFMGKSYSDNLHSIKNTGERGGTDGIRVEYFPGSTT